MISVIPIHMISPYLYILLPPLVIFLLFHDVATGKAIRIVRTVKLAQSFDRMYWSVENVTWRWERNGMGEVSREPLDGCTWKKACCLQRQKMLL